MILLGLHSSAPHAQHPMPRGPCLGTLVEDEETCLQCKTTKLKAALEYKAAEKERLAKQQAEEEELQCELAQQELRKDGLKKIAI